MRISAASAMLSLGLALGATLGTPAVVDSTAEAKCGPKCQATTMVKCRADPGGVSVTQCVAGWVQFNSANDDSCRAKGHTGAALKSCRKAGADRARAERRAKKKT